MDITMLEDLTDFMLEFVQERCFFLAHIYQFILQYYSDGWDLLQT